MREHISKDDLALFRRYPSLFPQDNSIYDPMKSCLAFGIQCRPGWMRIIEETCRRLSELEGVEVIQIKEKFGELRFYVQGPDDAYAVAFDAEKEAERICENCGNAKEEGTTIVKGHRYGFCDDCLRVLK